MRGMERVAEVDGYGRVEERGVKAARRCDVVPGLRHNKWSCNVATDVLQAIARHIVRVADTDGDEDEQVRLRERREEGREREAQTRRGGATVTDSTSHGVGGACLSDIRRVNSRAKRWQGNSWWGCHEPSGSPSCPK
jgi:hypothetical protein